MAAPVLMRPLSRPEPLMDPRAYQTYTIARPISWWVFATCEQVDCPAWLRGWTTVVDEDRARTCRASQRQFTETRAPGGLVAFQFGPGQRCFAHPPPELVGQPIMTVLPRLDASVVQVAERWHKRVLPREPLFGLLGGDWRGNPTGQRVRFRDHRQFLDDFGEHQQRIADQQWRG